MTFVDDIPAINNEVGSDLTNMLNNFTHLKDAISQEHGWSDSDATQTTHNSNNVLGFELFSNQLTSDLIVQFGTAFQPDILICLAQDNINDSWSVGIASGTNVFCIGSFGDGNIFYSSSQIFRVGDDSFNYQYGVLDSMNSNGFTIDRGVLSAPTNATTLFGYLAIKLA